MTRFIRVLVVGVIALGLSSGCVSWQQVQLKTDVENLKREVAKMKKAQGADGGSDINQVRARLADVTATIEGLRTEVGLLGGRIESAQHNNDEVAKELTKVKADLEAKLARIEEKMLLLEASVGGTTPVPTPTGAAVVATPTPAESSPTAEPSPTTLAKNTDEALYRQAITLMDGERHDKARKAFEKLIKRWPDSSLADNSRFWIGETYYREKEYASSILEYQKVVESYPKGDKVPAALFKQGLAFLQIGEKEGGLATLQQLVTKYPKSREATMAKDAIKKAKKG